MSPSAPKHEQVQVRQSLLLQGPFFFFFFSNKKKIFWVTKRALERLPEETCHVLCAYIRLLALCSYSGAISEGYCLYHVIRVFKERLVILWPISTQKNISTISVNRPLRLSYKSWTGKEIDLAVAILLLLFFKI